MRRTLLAVTTVLLLVGCSGEDDGAASPPDDTQDSALSTTTRQGRVTRPPIDVIAGVVCDDAAKRIAGDPEAPNGSWECTKKAEHVRIDFYVDEAEQQKAKEQLLAFYKDAGDNRSLAELPIICGPRFGIGTDTNATRDALIAELNGAEIAASICD